MIDTLMLRQTLFAKIAPLPLSLGTHLYHSWIAQERYQYDGEATQRFLEDFSQNRRDVYIYMDSFVRNNKNDVPHNQRYSTQWLREELGHYTPTKKPVPSKTFNEWVSNGFIRNSKKGYPTPESGAALYIIRIMLTGTRLLYDAPLDSNETWGCFAQDRPDSESYQISVNQISDLPNNALLWTDWPGAAWDSHWRLIADGPAGKYFGAIRFAQAETIHGETYYSLSQKDLLGWVPEYVLRYNEGSFSSDRHQINIQAALIDLAENRISKY